MSTQSSTPSVASSHLDDLQTAVSTGLSYLNSLIKWVLVVNIVGLAGFYWVNLIRINLALGQPNKAAVALVSFIGAVFAVIAWLYGVGVFDKIDLGVLDRLGMGNSTPN